MGLGGSEKLWRHWERSSPCFSARKLKLQEQDSIHMGLFPSKIWDELCFLFKAYNKSLSHNHYFPRWALLIHFGILKHILEFTLATAIQLNTESGKSSPLLICPDFSSIPFLCDCLTEKNGKGPKSLKFGAIKGLPRWFSDTGTQTSDCVKNPNRSMYKTYQSHLLEGCHHHYQYISSAVWGEEMSVFVTQKGQGILLLMRLPVHSQIPPPVYVICGCFPIAIVLGEMD